MNVGDLLYRVVRVNIFLCHVRHKTSYFNLDFMTYILFLIQVKIIYPGRS